MSLWNYRSEAIGHVWELVSLGCERPDDCKQLYEVALDDPKSIDTFIAENKGLILDIVLATPSRRKSMLRRMAEGDSLAEFALILGAWQHCRKAVLSYDWLQENDGRFTPGQPYRVATASQGQLFTELRARRWTKWPFQWGKSPFPGEKSRRDPYDAPDYNEMMDKYDPATGMY